jgi:hypothetical protein
MLADGYQDAVWFHIIRITLLFGVVIAVTAWVIFRSWHSGNECVKCGFDIRSDPDKCPKCGAVPTKDSPPDYSN